MGAHLSAKAVGDVADQDARRLVARAAVDQRFFIRFAQIWRTLMRKDALRQQVMTDPHSPGEYRTNGVLRNIPEFYAAFNVRAGTFGISRGLTRYGCSTR